MHSTSMVSKSSQRNTLRMSTEGSNDYLPKIKEPKNRKKQKVGTRKVASRNRSLNFSTVSPRETEDLSSAINNYHVGGGGTGS